MRATLYAAANAMPTMHLKSLMEGHVPDLLVDHVIDCPSEAEIRALADDAADVLLRTYRPS